MAVSAKVSVEEFQSMPDPTGRLELHEGEIVSVPAPSPYHQRLQLRIQDLLGSLLRPAGYLVGVEFWISPEENTRRVDVAAIHSHRYPTSRTDVFRGVPELVIEVLSPTNPMLDINRLRGLCLRNGAKEFWVVDPEASTVTVYKTYGVTAIHQEYGSGASIPVEFVPGASLTVDSIFS
jgi:Uma2 family endonuclease